MKEVSGRFNVCDDACSSLICILLQALEIIIVDQNVGLRNSVFSKTAACTTIKISQNEHHP